MRYIILILSLSLFSISLAQAQREMLVLNRKNGQLVSVKLANPNSPKILIGQTKETDLYRSLDIVAFEKERKLFWIDISKRSIQRGNKEAKSEETFDQDSLGAIVDMDIDWINDEIYWVDHFQEKLFKADLINGNRSLIILGELNQPSSLAVSSIESRLFWTELGIPKIFYSTLNGDSIQQFSVRSTEYPIRLAVDDAHQKIYWSSHSGNNIGRSNFDGSQQELIFQGLEGEHPFGLFIDQIDQKIYWTDYGTDKVMRSNLDGSEVEEVLTGLNDPVAVVIQYAPGNQKLQNQENLSLSNNSQAEISIFPNPSYDNITLVLSSNQTDKSEITIYNQLGKIVRQFERSGHVHQIHTSDLPGGLYYCKVKIGDQELQKQFVLIR